MTKGKLFGLRRTCWRLASDDLLIYSRLDLIMSVFHRFSVLNVAFFIMSVAQCPVLVDSMFCHISNRVLV